MKKNLPVIIASTALLWLSPSGGAQAAGINVATDATAAQTPDSPEKTEAVFSIDDEGKGHVYLTVTMPLNYEKDWSAGTQDALPTDAELKLTIQRSSWDAGESERKDVVTVTGLRPGETWEGEDPVEFKLGFNYNYYSIVEYEGVSSGQYGGSGYVYVGIKPAPVEDLTVTSDKGAAPVTISFTVPSTDDLGNPLAVGLTKATLSRAQGWGNAEVIKVWDNPSASKTLTWTDTPVADGSDDNAKVSYRYIVTTECAYGKSSDKDATVGLFADRPATPSELNAAQADEGVVLTWGAVTEGSEHGYVDPAGVTYDIYRVYSYNNKVKLNESGINGLEYTDDLSGIGKEMEICWEIKASNAMGSCPYGKESGKLIVGPGQELPYSEEFNTWENEWSVKSDNLWQSVATEGSTNWSVTDQSYWYDGASYPYIYGADRTEGTKDGFMNLNLNSYIEKGAATSTSGKIIAKDKTNVCMTFSVYHIPGAGGEAVVDIVGPFGATAQSDATGNDSATVIPVAGDTEGWQEYSIELPEVSDMDYFRIRFTGRYDKSIMQNSAQPICIDKIAVKENKPDGVDGAACDGTVSVRWFDLQGREIASPVANSVMIRMEIDSAGHVRTGKVMVK